MNRVKLAILNWIKSKLGITKLETALAYQIGVNNRLQNNIKEHLTVHTDVSFNKHNSSHIILIGKFRGVDHVSINSVSGDCFKDLAPYILDMAKRNNASLGRIDEPRFCGFSETLRNDYERY